MRHWTAGHYAASHFHDRHWVQPAEEAAPAPAVAVVTGGGARRLVASAPYSFQAELPEPPEKRYRPSVVVARIRVRVRGRYRVVFNAAPYRSPRRPKLRRRRLGGAYARGLAHRSAAPAGALPRRARPRAISQSAIAAGIEATATPVALAASRPAIVPSGSPAESRAAPAAVFRVAAPRLAVRYRVVWRHVEIRRIEDEALVRAVMLGPGPFVWRRPTVGSEPYTEPWRAAQWRAFDASIKPIERHFRDRSIAAFVALGGVAARSLRTSQSTATMLAETESASLAIFQRLGVEEFPAMLRHGWDRANRQVSALLRRRAAIDYERRGVFDLAWPEIATYLRNRPRRYAPKITRTTVNGMRAVIADAVADGFGTEDIARAIAEHFAHIARPRSDVIARTEVVSASGKGSLESYRASEDVVEAKGWLATRDDRVRDTHAEADGQEVPVNEPFIVGGVELMHPGDPNAGDLGEIIGCRCALVPVVKGF